ncbi:hypothetical protein A7X67_00860 [Clostridium sp. W14A]|nr:hypothetical protein A7X67_00860 [Clostridium sp. W14A]
MKSQNGFKKARAHEGTGAGALQEPKNTVEIWKKQVYNENCRAETKSAKQEQGVGSTLPPVYGEHSPYTTVFTAQCRTYYTSFFCICTEGGRGSQVR